ncbi:hypothetical protein DFQ27_003923 [Actinomortierella ambigua]|uniref:Uncharacterized protein n=1 Tax=Actinomortierella ambigua TaxID=1343610 RepID=A0A9P6Q5Z3_9FUNG|nr:hypothetical protein DFQ27_003923 [Actinomortierella ambigua]
MASTSLFDSGISARTFQNRVQSTLNFATPNTFGYLPQHFDLKSSYWDKLWKSGSIHVRHQTQIIGMNETAGNEQAASVERDQHCHNGWTTHHSRCQATCDFIFYGHLRPDARTKARQELFRLGCRQSNSVHDQSYMLDDPEQQIHGPQFRTKLVPAAILVLPCSLISSFPQYKGLPNEEFGSDHLSLVTKFRFEDEQIISNKSFSREQVDRALNSHHRQWHYSVPTPPEPFDSMVMVPRPHRPHARDHHGHHHSRTARDHQHDHESHQDRERDSQRGWDRGRGRDNEHRRGSTRGRGRNRKKPDVEVKSSRQH